MKVVHCRRESYSHYIGRPSKFGNPFTLMDYSRTDAVDRYEDYARKSPESLEAIKQLPEDAVLGCFCKPHVCHGDVIMKLWKELHNEEKQE